MGVFWLVLINKGLKLNISTLFSNVLSMRPHNQKTLQRFRRQLKLHWVIHTWLTVNTEAPHEHLLWDASAVLWELFSCKSRMLPEHICPLGLGNVFAETLKDTKKHLIWDLKAFLQRRGGGWLGSWACYSAYWRYVLIEKPIFSPKV